MIPFRMLKNTANLYPLQKQIIQRITNGKKFAREYLKLEQILKDDYYINEESLIEETYKTATFFPLFAKSYADLMNLSLTENQLKVQAILGALARVQDTLCDELSDHFPNEKLDELYKYPEKYKPIFEVDKLAQTLYLRLINIMPKNQFPNYHETLNNLNESQKKSKKQKNGEQINEEEIWQISIEKGSYAILAFLHAIKPELKKEDFEYQTISSLGYFQIIGDDIFDRVKDTKAGIRTPTNTSPFEIIKQRIIKLRDDSLHNVSILPYNKERKDWFMFNVYVATIPGLAKLEQLSKGKDYINNMRQLKGFEKFKIGIPQTLSYINNCFKIGWKYDYDLF